jgi:hypothetical protein
LRIAVAFAKPSCPFVVPYRPVQFRPRAVNKTPMDFFNGLWTGSSSVLLVTTTAVSTVATLSFLRWYLYPAHEKIMPSPLKTVIPHLSKDEVAKLEYAPDAFPGARDVETPVRVPLSHNHR